MPTAFTNVLMQLQITKISILLSILLLLACNANAQFSQVKHSVYFDSDKYEINESEEKELLQLWDTLADDSILRIFIVGNTDNSADSLYNINLSQNRCNSVQDFFTHRKVNKTVFKVNYFGENKPIASNISEEGKQLNRRVDIRIVYTAKAVLSVVEPVVVEIDSCLGNDTTIILDNGTQLIFNTCEYNEIKECLQIKSARTTEELIEHNLRLETDNNIPLVTCGMIGLCLSPDCKTPNPLTEYITTVRFPFPDKPSCIPCSGNNAKVFLFNDDGSWTESTKPDDEIRIVRANGLKFYEMEMVINSKGCGWTNCDCKPPKCPKKWWKRRKDCPKARVKVPFGYTLIEAQIFIDCPQTMFDFAPADRKFLRRKRLGKKEVFCFYEPSLIQVVALDRKGDTLKLEPSPIDSVKHRIIFSKCKGTEKDKQKIMGIFSAKKRLFYKKYKIRKQDLTKE